MARDVDEKCETCRFYFGGADPTYSGYCRKSSPRDLNWEERFQVPFPGTPANQWCGDYEPVPMKGKDG